MNLYIITVANMSITCLGEDCWIQRRIFR